MWNTVACGLLVLQGALGAHKETSELPGAREAIMAAIMAAPSPGALQWLDEAMVFCDEPGAELQARECAALRRGAAPNDARVPWVRLARVHVRTGFEGRLVRAAADVP